MPGEIIEQWDTEPNVWDREHVHMQRNDGGAWCGYVGVGKKHPLYGVHYNDYVPIPPNFSEREFTDRSPVLPLFTLDHDRYEQGEVSLDVAIDVHGGITYAGRAYWDEASPLWWFGFDCAHSTDLAPKYYKLVPYVGMVYRTFEYAQQETLKLATQLARWQR